ncbi:MAG: LemA family protein, partial [Sandaracinobacteroides sp.]
MRTMIASLSTGPAIRLSLSPQCCNLQNGSTDAASASVSSFRLEHCGAKVFPILAHIFVMQCPGVRGPQIMSTFLFHPEPASSQPSLRLQKMAMAFALLLIGTLVSGCGYNNVPTLEERAKGAWGEVQNQYQRRADLIPNLVETVKGFAQQEREVLTQVIEARAKATQIKIDASTITDPARFKEFQDAQNGLSGALGRLLVVSERYPELKSNQNFLALQSQLEGTENRITVARRDYIETVRAYNTEVRTFPGVIWAKLVWGAKPMESFTATTGSERPP